MNKLTNFINNERFYHVREKIIENKEKLLLSSFTFGFCLLILKLFDVTTLIYIFIIFISLICLVYIKGLEAIHNGLIYYLPSQLQNTILRRSVFDILMDIWYLPTLTKYFTLLIKPVLYKLSPEEAIKVLEDFDPNTRKFFLTKKALLPQIECETKITNSNIQKNLTSEENISDSTREENNIPNEKNIINNYSNEHTSCKNSLKDSKENGLNLQNNKTQKNMIISIKPKQKSKLSSDSSIISLVDNNFKNNFFSHNILLEEKLFGQGPKINSYDFYEKEFPLSTQDEINPISIIQKKKCLEPTKCDEMLMAKMINKDDDYRYYEIEDDTGKVMYKTIVIESTNKIKNRNRFNQNSSMNDLNDFCWDNIHEYYKKEAKNALKDNKDEQESISFVQLFTKKVQQHLMNKIDYNKLSKASAIFLITFLIQMIISKRARRWSLSFLQFAIYMATSLGAGGTLYFLLKRK